MLYLMFALCPIVGETVTAWETPLGYVGKWTVAPRVMVEPLVVFA